MNLPSSVQNMPPAVKAGGALVAGGGVLAALAIMFPGGVLVVIALGIVLVGGLFAAYKALLKWMEKRKAAPMERALAGNSAAAPTSINNPARRARLDDMRKSFEAGVTKFRDAGKNLYSLPWYVLVGEPGSGKTEAIRHCNVGFPPGLQDQLQGVGGTINMNWWFTNYAVILDTAGRLMFEEVEPGTTSEWQEFMKLMRKVRPSCPVNGMLLVVPAESLIRDTADAIERKAGKIAQQLDGIQRALGVRFPVYVVVTKCDLINGFREFFDDLSDPQLQHQMLGWSNPGSLDDKFDPEQVEQHLRTVQQRLTRRRLALLQDPVHTEDSTKKRTEQVDALYAFPDAMMKIAPRLRRYLEMIFVAGEWSQKPLFLRGIYFTSSMREGSALDADLAEALGMPVESLPEGRVWERERAYFLRDLFMNKVFREKGLVTRATNTSTQMRKRRSAVYGTAAVGAVAVALLTFFGWRSMTGAVAGPSNFWKATKEVYIDKGAQPNWVSGDRPYFLPLAHPRAKDQAVFDYDGVSASATRSIEAIPIDDSSHKTIGDFPLELKAQAQREIGIPWVYKPVAAITGFNVTNLAAGERAAAASAIFDRSVLEPLIDYARVKFQKETGDDSDSTPWSPQASAALRSLIALEAAAVKPGIKTVPERMLSDLSGYVLRQPENEGPEAEARAQREPGFKTDYDAYKASQAEATRQIAKLQDVADWLYSPKLGAQPWPPAQIRTGNVAVLSRAFDRFSKQAGRDSPEAAGYDQVDKLRLALKDLGDKEQALLEVHTITPDTARAWDERYARLRDAAKAVEGLLPALGTRALAKAFDDEFINYQRVVGKAHDTLLEQFLPVIDAEGAPDEKLAKSDKSHVEELQALHEKIRRSRSNSTTRSPAIEAAASECGRLDALYLKTGGRTDFAFRQRLALYAAADVVRTPAEGELTVDLGALPTRQGAIDRAVTEAKGKIDQSQKAATLGAPEAKPADDLVTKAGKVSSDYAGDVAGGGRRAALLGKWMDDLMAEGKPLEARAAALSAAKGWKTARPTVPLTRAAAEHKDSFDPGFDPRAATALLADCAQVAAAAKPGEGRPALPKELGDRVGALQQASDRYSQRYLAYWTTDLLTDLSVPEMSWDDFAKSIKGLSSDSLNTPLAQVAEVVGSAFTGVPQLAPGAAGDPAELRRQVENAKASLRTNQSISSGRIFANWLGLGDNAATAADALRLALKDVPGFQEKYIFCYRAPAPPQPLGNFVEKFWEDFCFAGLSAISMRAQGNASAAYQQVRSKIKFPVVVTGTEGEMAPGAVAQLKKDAELASTLGVKQGDSGARPAIACERFAVGVNQLVGAGALTTNEQEWLFLVREVVGGLPDTQPFKCKILTTTDRQLQPGEKPLDGVFIDMGVVAGENPPASGVRIRNNNAALGEFNLPDPAPLSFYFFIGEVGQNKIEPAATFRIEGSWAIIRLLARYDAERSTTDKRHWYLKLPVTFQNEKYYTWLKIEMEKELPELKRWKELKPAPAP